MAGRLGLIAGNGRLPFEVLEAARERGREVVVVAMENTTDPAIEHAPHLSLLWNPVGQLARMIDFLKNSGAEEVILAGGVAKREALRDPASLQLDELALTLLARMKERGDDAILRMVAAEIESRGLTVTESTGYLKDRLTREGCLAGPEPDPALLSDLELGLRVAAALGAQDVGQSVVVKQGSVLAVEAVEGTDATIRRGAELGGAGVVVVKASKPSQDLRFDVPAIGPATIELASRCQLSAIGLEAGRTIVLERDRTLELAERAGLVVFGLRARKV